MFMIQIDKIIDLNNEGLNSLISNKVQFKMQNQQQDLMDSLKNFMLYIHSQLTQQPIITSSDIDVIDQAARELTSNQQNMASMINKNKEIHSSRAAIDDYKKQCTHLQKRLNRKNEETDILKQTVKTLYQDNEKLAKQKQNLSNQMVALKQQNNSLKKKVKRQEEELGNNKTDLQKLTSMAEERLGEYLKEDQQKQIKIKKMQNQIDKLKSQLNKKEKSLNSNHRKLEELKGIQLQYENSLTMIETLKHENKMVKAELENIKENIHDQKVKYLNENQQLLKQIESLNEKQSQISSEKQQIYLKWQAEIEKVSSYEDQMMMRTEKLKEKNRQIKAYNEEIQKLAKRVKELSQMADEVMDENRQLTARCAGFEQKLEQFKIVHSHLGKLSGELSYKKGVELGRMIDYINKLQASL